MNIPNFLTLIRIILIPVIVIFLIQGAFVKALIVLVLSAVTDALDGFFARILKQQTVLGAYLDPIADKALIASCFLTLSIEGYIPVWLTVIVISRDFIILVGIVVLSILTVPLKIRPAFISKVTTALQLIAVIMTLLFKILPGLFEYWWLIAVHMTTAFFTVVSGLNYMMFVFRINSDKI